MSTIHVDIAKLPCSRHSFLRLDLSLSPELKAFVLIFNLRIIILIVFVGSITRNGG
jgi:hypothetical protein